MKIIQKHWFPYIVGVLLLHLVGITYLLLAARSHTVFLGLGFLAYTLGLRHAFDADHIAAIDNIIRKQITEERKSYGVGFTFSLGHSTVVFLAILCTMVLAAKWIHESWSQIKIAGGYIGTVVSGSFLIIIAMINISTLFHTIRILKQWKLERKSDGEVQSFGFLTRFAPPFIRLVRRGWQVYLLGFLFGLGFDTASEIMLLTISSGVAKWCVLSLPILFAAGMSLMDTLDGIFMTKSYRWALDQPIRKIYYNLTVTTILIELTQMAFPLLKIRGNLSNINLSLTGFGLVLLFAIVWSLFYSVRKWNHAQEK